MPFFLEHGTMNKSYKEIFCKFFTAIESESITKNVGSI